MLPDWTETVLPKLGNNSHGVSYAEQKAIKYVSSIDLQLIEEDSGLTFGDDVSTHGTAPLGPVSGSRVIPPLNFFGGDYTHRGGALSHSRPARPCNAPSDCAAPHICAGGFCRQGFAP